ncbi:MAG: hypothetical protein M3R04_02595 [bacterium]|nr:hypothetical protein [bacterium]
MDQSKQIQLPEVLRKLSRKSQLISLDALCHELRYAPEDCEKLVGPLMESGILRRTTTSDGQVYFWLCAPTAELVSGTNSTSDLESVAGTDLFQRRY